MVRRGVALIVPSSIEERLRGLDVLEPCAPYIIQISRADVW